VLPAELEEQPEAAVPATAKTAPQKTQDSVRIGFDLPRLLA
jgi:hypothetical protein